MAAAAMDRYRWDALSNTTMAVFMSALDGSIVIISLPAIFRGIHLDPLAPGNISYLLWMIMGYRLVQAVLVVSVGRIGDMYGRVRIYNAGFAVFAASSLLLSFDPFVAGAGAVWLIGWRGGPGARRVDADRQLGGDPDRRLPADRRGFALGVNQIAALAGQFIGLIAGGVLAAIDWRAVFWVNVPVGDLRHRLGLPEAARLGRAARGQDRLVGERHLHGRPQRDPGRDHHRPAALRRPRRWGGPTRS